MTKRPLKGLHFFAQTKQPHTGAPVLPMGSHPTKRHFANPGLRLTDGREHGELVGGLVRGTRCKAAFRGSCAWMS
jgi:hypothetical protein